MNWTISNINFNRSQTACRFLNETLHRDCASRREQMHERNKLCHFPPIDFHSQFPSFLTYFASNNRYFYSLVSLSNVVRLNFHRDKTTPNFWINEQHCVILRCSKAKYFATHSTIYMTIGLSLKLKAWERNNLRGYVQNCKSSSRLTVNTWKKSEPF